MAGLFDLDGRVALVTGGGTGLGRAFATALAGAGARVAVAGRREAPLAKTVAALQADGHTADAVTADVTDEPQVEAAFERIEAALGPVDIVVNNAGIAHAGPLLDIDDADWNAVIDTNLTAVHRVARTAARRLRAAGRPGAIVNIASILGLRVSPGLGAYVAAKAAVVQLTRAQALEWARDGIRVNAIAPGYYETDMNRGFFDTPAGEKMIKRIPMRRTGEPRELAGALLLLASDAGSYMTGSVVTVDGGHMCSSL